MNMDIVFGVLMIAGVGFLLGIALHMTRTRKEGDEGK
jgi:hypothetical protein